MQKLNRNTNYSKRWTVCLQISRQYGMKSHWTCQWKICLLKSSILRYPQKESHVRTTTLLTDQEFNYKLSFHLFFSAWNIVEQGSVQRQRPFLLCFEPPNAVRSSSKEFVGFETHVQNFVLSCKSMTKTWFLLPYWFWPLTT